MFLRVCFALPLQPREDFGAVTLVVGRFFKAHFNQCLQGFVHLFFEIIRISTPIM